MNGYSIRYSWIDEANRLITNAVQLAKYEKYKREIRTPLYQVHTYDWENL